MAVLGCSWLCLSVIVCCTMCFGFTFDLFVQIGIFAFYVVRLFMYTKCNSTFLEFRIRLHFRYYY